MPPIPSILSCIFLSSSKSRCYLESSSYISTLSSSFPRQQKKIIMKVKTEVKAIARPRMMYSNVLPPPLSSLTFTFTGVVISITFYCGITIVSTSDSCSSGVSCSSGGEGSGAGNGSNGRGVGSSGSSGVGSYGSSSNVSSSGS